MHPIEVAFKRIKMPGPVFAERCEPGVDLEQGLRFEPVDPALGVDSGFDEAGVLENAEVLGDGRLRQPELTLDFPDRPLSGEQQGQNGPSVGLGEDGEGGLHGTNILLMAYTCQGILSPQGLVLSSRNRRAMTPTPLPAFRYHPDPLATGSIIPSPAACRRCGQARGYIYTGPVYAIEELEDAFCPWCIADGSAAGQFDAEFVDPEAIGGYGTWDPVSGEVTEEVSRRTPGFNGWQQERWWTHCGDAAEFLGVAGHSELESRWPAAIPAIRVESELEGADWDDYFRSLDRDQGPTAYIFRCRGCGGLGGYSDIH